MDVGILDLRTGEGGGTAATQRTPAGLTPPTRANRPTTAGTSPPARQLDWRAGPQMESTALAASHGQHGSRVRHLEKCYMATKRKTSGARVTLRRPSRQRHSPSAGSASANEEQFIFTFSLSAKRRSPACCIINVVAHSPGAALRRAQAVLDADSMLFGVSVADETVWPHGKNDMEYVRVYITRPCALTLNDLIMISDMDANYIVPDRTNLGPKTDVGDLFY